MFSMFPAYVSLSNTRTSWPFRTARRAKFEPMKPAPPVTRIRMRRSNERRLDNRLTMCQGVPHARHPARILLDGLRLRRPSGAVQRTEAAATAERVRPHETRGRAERRHGASGGAGRPNVRELRLGPRPQEDEQCDLDPRAAAPPAAGAALHGPARLSLVRARGGPDRVRLVGPARDRDLPRRHAIVPHAFRDGPRDL